MVRQRLELESEFNKQRLVTRVEQFRRQTDQVALLGQECCQVHITR